MDLAYFEITLLFPFYTKSNYIGHDWRQDFEVCIHMAVLYFLEVRCSVITIV